MKRWECLVAVKAEERHRKVKCKWRRLRLATKVLKMYVENSWVGHEYEHGV